MRFNKKTALALGIALLLYSHSFAQAQKKPNIIFILTDDLGYGDIGVFYQNQRKEAGDRSKPWTSTPNLDKIAAKGAMLMQHYCPAPVCAPSRASLMLGVNQGHANVRDNQFDKALEDNYNMANVMKKLGYTTAAIGKWGLQGKDKNQPKGTDAWVAQPLKRGFDHFYGYMRHGDGHEHYPKEAPYAGGRQKQVWANMTDVTNELDKCYTGDLWTAAAKQWIINTVQKDHDQPFFMYLAYDTPHAVLELPTQAYPAGGGLKGGVQWLGKPGHMINTALGTIDSWTHPDYANATYDDDHNAATPEVPWPDTYKRYATVVRRIDSEVGDIMQLLKDLKIDSNTIVVFSSDNGPSVESYLPKNYVANLPTFFDSFGPFDGIKRDVWEGGTRMPAMAMWPGHIPAGKVVQAPNAAYDWLATFADAAGVAAPVRTDGVSLLPDLTGKGKQRESKVYIEYFEQGKTPNYSVFDAAHRGRKRGQMQVIRNGDLVGVRYDIQSHADDFEIYNVVKDPAEKKNLAKEPGMAALQKQMKERVLQMRRPDPEATRPYDKELVAPVQPKSTLPGLTWQFFAGDFPWIPDVAALPVTAKGNVKTPGQSLNQKKDGVVCYQGYLKVPADGEYTFYASSKDRYFLRIHDAAVLDADFNPYAGGKIKGKMLLKAGLHPIRFYCLSKANQLPAIQLSWEGPGIAHTPIPEQFFVRN
jgi:arylsulfatase A-like enzyme